MISIRAGISGIFFLLGITASGQTRVEKFKQLKTDKDTLGQRLLLEEWQNATPDDPELYASYFTYYIEKSRTEKIRPVHTDQGKYLPLKDSAGHITGYMYGEATYNPDYLVPGFERIDEGISKFPDRLDMRFGKIHMLGEIHDYDSFTTEIVKCIVYSGVNKNAWLWTMNEPVKNPKDFLLTNTQSYVNHLFSYGDVQVKNVRRIAEATLSVYRDHIMSLSNLGITYILEEDYEKALEALLKAEKKSPKDAVVMGNIAYVYSKLKDNKKAGEYYQKMIQFGDADAKTFAREQLNKLNEQ
ncbi:MAG TPA: tetratricopeptide repeat protein [Ohtaekwangia sp.]